MEVTGRDVRLLAQEVPQALPQTVVDQEASTHGEMKRRVLFLSAILAVYVVVNVLVQYAFDAAALESALEQIRAVTNEKGGPILAKLLMRMIPGATFSIMVGLLVPLCGYLGAKQNSQGLMGCFCGCNFLNCCCGMCSLVGTIIVLGLISATTPGIEEYLRDCDPVQCYKWPTSWSDAVKQQHTVDCLAAGMWPEYKKQFEGPSYPPICPKFLLQCDDDQPKAPPGFKPFQLRGMPGMPDPDMPVDFDPDSMAAMGLTIGEPELDPMPRRLQLSRPREWPEKTWRTLPKFDGADDDFFQAQIVMPPNPIANCKPSEKGVAILKQAHKVVPELVPKLVMFMAIKALLLMPVILFGCLGFWWGNELYNRLGQGYGHLGNHAAQQRISSPEAPVQMQLPTVQPLQVA
ncbi:unnamed protein product [Effrenium voratum]|uniref:Uncharacterized protein n=1 Tax=Effrenium voratum TaxID=2562239 RepID=A0AA36NHD3_9DINO|nr:unnamed protein product [Effrenium voratum]CAJ1416589.1 unnamed protein product [Effrenium voratum]